MRSIAPTLGAGNSWRWPRRLPATWSITTRTATSYHPVPNDRRAPRGYTEPVASATAEPPRERAREQARYEIHPEHAGLREPLARRALDLDGQRGCRHANPDPRAQHRVLAGDRDRRRDRRRRDADPRGESARDVRRRRQRGIAFALRIELAKLREIVVAACRREAIAVDLAHDRRDVVGAACRARRGDEQLHRFADRVRVREQQRERGITDEAVQTVAAQQHAIALAQIDDRE